MHRFHKLQSKHRSRAFQQFSACVALASLVWCILFWSSYDELFVDPRSVLESDSPEQRERYAEKRQGQTQNGRSESRHKTSSLGRNHSNTVDISNIHTRIESDSPDQRELDSEKRQEQAQNERSESRHKTSSLGRDQNNTVDISNIHTGIEVAKSPLQQENKPFPRVMVLGDEFGGIDSFSSDFSLQRDEETKKHPVLDDYQKYHWMADLGNLEVLLKGQFTEDYKTHCVDMMEWQSKAYPVCNSMHELGILGGSALAISDSGIARIGQGNWRSTYSIRNPHADEKTFDPRIVVLKLFQLDTDVEMPFDPRAYEMHRIDSLISQKMTSSPYVLNIYGHCGLTGIYEIGLDLEHEARFRNYKSEHTLDEPTKAKYAAHITRAVADLHGVDYDDPSNATIVHADIKPHNILLTYREQKLVATLGDFNNSILRKWNKTSNSPCPFHASQNPPSWGGGYKPLEHSTGDDTPLDESVDIFAMGAVMYFLLVGKTPYDQYPKGNFTTAMSSGELPPLPSPLRYGDDGDDNDNDTNYILAAIEASMKVHPNDRPTAKQIADLFRFY